MEYQGNVLKMRTEHSNPVHYFLPIGEQEISMNELIGTELKMVYDGRINCISCGKKTKTSFGQGFCYSCYQTVPEASETIMRPELSRAQFGIARDIEWAEKHDLIDHFVYLAASSGLKVGVTRHHQVPTRWIDQGASSAIKLAKTPNRHIAGVIEVFLKTHFSDKTNWREMLKNKVDESINLFDEKNNAQSHFPSELQQYISDEDEIYTFEYPVKEYPDKVNSVTFDKIPELQGTLKGIKGQYLLFDNNRVINLRKHNGYYLKVVTKQ